MHQFPANENLSILIISQQWAHEISPTRPLSQIIDDIIASWWRGYLTTEAEIGRIDILKHMYKNDIENAVFYTFEGSCPDLSKHHADGSVTVTLTPVIPVPNTDLESWNDLDCQKAFEAIADQWNFEDFPIISPALVSMKVSERSFSKWLLARGSTRPTFWASGNTRKQKVSSGKGPQLSEPEIHRWIEDQSRAADGESRSERLNQKTGWTLIQQTFPGRVQKKNFVFIWNQIHARQRGQRSKSPK